MEEEDKYPEDYFDDYSTNNYVDEPEPYSELSDEEEWQLQKEEVEDEIYNFFTIYHKKPLEERIKSTEKLIARWKLFAETEIEKELLVDIQKNLDMDLKYLKEKEKLTHQINEGIKKEVTQTAVSLQFKYENSLWAKLFNQRSYCNEVYGQALFHCVLGVITDLKIPINASQFINARPSIFMIQRTGSGKNQGMYFAEDSIKNLKKIENINNQILKTKPFLIRRMNKQNDPTLLDRYVTENKKGIQTIMKDDKNNPIIIKGILSESDLIWYPEADFLLNPTSKDNMEAVNIHLNLLETDGSYEKQLTQWQGFSTITKGGNYCMIALSRPIRNIREHIIYSGLLQRMLFIPRELTSEIRKKMTELDNIYSIRKEQDIKNYQDDFKELIKELEEIQIFSVQNKIKINESLIEEFSTSLNNNSKWFQQNLDEEIGNIQNKLVLEDFMSRYKIHLLIFAYQSALIRKSINVELMDLEYAFQFLKECFELFKPWIEENIHITKLDIEKQNKKLLSIQKLRNRLIPNKQNELVCSTTDAIKFIMNDLGCSYMTAKNILIMFSEGVNKVLIIDWDDKIIKFKIFN